MIKYLESEKIYTLWLKFQAIAICCIFIYFALYQFAPNYFGVLYSVPYRFCALLLIVSFLLLRRFKDGVEFKLIFFYCLWTTLMRVIDGSFMIEGVADSLFNRWVALPLCAFALMLPAEKRMKLMDIMALVYAAAYTLIAVVCVYAAPQQLTLINPITGTAFCEFVGGRLFVFWKNCNVVSIWFMMCCGFLFYLFFRSKKRFWKIIIVAAVFVNYAALSLTYGRSGQLSLSLGVAMLTAALALKKLPLKKLSHKFAAFILCMCICLPVYKGFELTTAAINSLTPEIKQSSVVTQAKAPADIAEIKTLSMVHGVTAKPVVSEKEQQDAQREVLIDRGMNSSGRLELWISSLQVTAQDPKLFITGKYEPIIDTNSYIKEHLPEQYRLYGNRLHLHNAYLEAFLYSGIPGFVLLMAFFVLLVYKMVKLYFCKESDMALICLIILLTALFIYNLFESALLHIYDMRTVIFFVLAGYMLAFEKELCCKN